jgi:antitoxin ParD1/3/4
MPEEMARAVKARVASGAYASESEVIREGLRALGVQEQAVERWLASKGVARFDAYTASPDNTLSAGEAGARLRGHIGKRASGGAR